MVRDKEFLKEIYQSDSPVRAKQLLQNSSDSKIKAFLIYLHFVANGEKKMSEELYDIQLDPFCLIDLSANETYRERKEKLNVLNKLAPKFSFLLHSVFNR